MEGRDIHGLTDLVPLSWHPPSILDVLVDASGDEHGDQGVVPGGDEHEGETQAHTQEGQGPGGDKQNQEHTHTPAPEKSFTETQLLDEYREDVVCVCVCVCVVVHKCVSCECLSPGWGGV